MSRCSFAVRLLRAPCILSTCSSLSLHVSHPTFTRNAQCRSAPWQLPSLTFHRFLNSSTTISDSIKKNERIFWYSVVNKNGEHVLSPTKITVTTETKIKDISKIAETSILKKKVKFNVLSAFEENPTSVRNFLDRRLPLSQLDKNAGTPEAPLKFFLFEAMKTSKYDELMTKINNFLPSLQSADQLKFVFDNYKPKTLAAALGKMTREERDQYVIERVEELRQVYGLFADRFVTLVNDTEKSDDRTYNFLLALMGAPGSGKSFFLDLIARKHLLFQLLPKDSDDKNVFLSRFHSAVAVPITLNSNTEFRFQKDSESVSHLLGLRVLFSYFSQFVQVDSDLWDSWFVYFGKDFIELDDAVDLVRQHYSKYVSGLPFNDQHLILLVDEIYKLNGFRSLDKATSALGYILKNKQVHVVVSSLSMHTLNDNTNGPSIRRIKWIRLDPLKVKATVAVFEPLFEKSDEQRTEKLRIVEAILAACGGHARSISALYRYIEYLKATKGDILKITVTSFVQWDDFQDQSRIDTPSKEVIEWALCGKHVDLKTKIPPTDPSAESADKLIVQGKIYNSLKLLNEKFVPRVLPLQLLRLTEQHFRVTSTLEEMFRNHLHSLKKHEIGKSFERFHACWHVLMSQTNRLEYARELYPFTHSPDGKEDVPLSAMFFPELNSLKWNHEDNAKVGSFEDKNEFAVPIIVKKILYWGPRVFPSEFKLKKVITTHEEQQLPPSNVTDFVKDQNDDPIELLGNVIFAGHPTNPGCDSQIYFKTSNGEMAVWCVDNKFKSDPKSRHAITKADALQKYQKCLDTLSPHCNLPFVNGKYKQSIIGNLNISPRNIYVVLVSLHDNTKTSIVNENVLIVGRDVMEVAYTPSLTSLGLFVSTK